MLWSRPSQIGKMSGRAKLGKLEKKTSEVLVAIAEKEIVLIEKEIKVLSKDENAGEEISSKWKDISKVHKEMMRNVSREMAKEEVRECSA